MPQVSPISFERSHLDFWGNPAEHPPEVLNLPPFAFWLCNNEKPKRAASRDRLLRCGFSTHAFVLLL
jgi:hypothetical protein